MPDKIKLRINYVGGGEQNGLVDMYSGTRSIHGMCRALQIVTHAFTQQEMIHHSTAAKGANFYLARSHKGSFIQDLLIEILSSPVGQSITAAVLYDMIKVVFGKAIGQLHTPETPYLSKLNSEDEPFLDSVSEAVEGPLLDAHRTIADFGGTVDLEKARSSLLQFNSQTLEWVKTRIESDTDEEIEGFVTRYNVNTGNGRLFDAGKDKIYPFRPFGSNKYGVSSRSLLSWSLDQENNELAGDLIFKVRRVISNNGFTKRYVLISCRKMQP